jgi:geranylgeranyl diphosphate synthase type I
VATSPLDRADLRRRVSTAVEAMLARQRPRLAAISPNLLPLAEALTAFLDGGKRLRPAFAYWGWRGAGGADCDEIVAAVSALEWVQACALIHDDVMDGSDTRRGQPAMHRRFEALHRTAGWRGAPDGFGTAIAILLGDMALIWADEMLNRSGLPAEQLLRGQPVYDEMRTEIMAGQYLDILGQVTGDQSVEGAMNVIRYKSAKYTVERPLHLGAALAGGSPALIAAYSAYGMPLGEAFQLRDDVLGVFGDPAQTGKPAGDDLREGKRTVLVATTLARASAAESDYLERQLGRPDLDEDGIANLRDLITSTGALSDIEKLIGELTEQSIAALHLDELDDESADVLRELAIAATARKV